jgi:hypothetical protein
MGEDKGIEPEGGFRAGTDQVSEQPDDETSEGHGWRMAKDQAPDEPGMKPEGGVRQAANDDQSDEDTDKPSADKHFTGFSDVNLKVAIVPVRW